MLFIFLVIFGMDFKCLVVSSYMTSKGWVKGGTVGSVEGGGEAVVFRRTENFSISSEAI